jgi:Phosphotransferase enzyme family
MNVSDRASGEIADVARALVGGPIDAFEQIGGGRNSRVFHVHSNGRSFALKQYPSRDEDPRDRLGTEVGALRLMELSGFEVVPRVVATDARRGFALLSWIDGAAVKEVTESDIDAAVAFLARIHSLRTTPWAVQQPAAAEACLAGTEIERQIATRLDRLRTVSRNEAELIDFLANSFEPRFADMAKRSKQSLAAARLDFTSELPQVWRSLVPSDFGFHNSLRRKDGSLAFLDFEYFGWDDPVKLTADIMLHPGQRLGLSLWQRFRSAAVGVYGDDRSFAARLAAFYPLFGLRWVLILLNEFIPERWHRRVQAGETGSWSDAKARQLRLGRELLASLSNWVEE